MSNTASPHKTRFAVVGLGHIAQVAVLPAFEHAENCELAALVSGDDEKLRELAQRYGVARAVTYDSYDELLQGDSVDAVYIALPNDLHADYAIRAANRGVHVLCEKPMAPTEEECEAMIDAARANDVRLMLAYRLHFEHINLEVADLLRQGAIGDPRLFVSVFSQDVKPGDIRLAPWDRGGGSVFDMGVYCINAARYLFGDEPVEVVAATSQATEARFEHCDEMTSAVLRFPSGRMAQFCSSFGATRSGQYRVMGTEGEVVVHHAYDYAKEMSYELRTRSGDVRTRKMAKRDQFAPELVYFADCIQAGSDPEPNGWEGYADVRIVRAVHQAALSGTRVELEPIARSRRPSGAQAIRRPGIDKPPEINAEGPGR